MSKKNIKLDFNSAPRLNNAALDICRILHDAGGRAFFVGGCVRDAVIGGRAIKDFDIECYHLTAQSIKDAISRHYALDAVGMSFGVFKIHHYDIDVSLPRKESKTGAGHRGFMIDCVPELTFAEASSRRDFTINAMSYDPLSQELIDLWGGCDDLDKKILRHVSEHFSEDPLRVLRAMQFSSRFDFSIAHETVELCSTIPQNELSRERIATEWEKMLLQGKKISNGLKFLKNCGWIEASPELAEVSRSAEKWESLLSETDRIYKLRNGDTERDLALALAVICSCFRIDEEIGNFISRIWNRRNLVKKVSALVKNIPLLFKNDKLLLRCSSECGGADILLAAIEILYKERCDGLYRKAVEAGVLCSPPQAVVTGKMLLKYRISPGIEMGECLKKAFEAQLNGEFTDSAGAEIWLEKNLSH